MAACSWPRHGQTSGSYNTVKGQTGLWMFSPLLWCGRLITMKISCDTGFFVRVTREMGRGL